MISRIPEDISAETLLNYIPIGKRGVNLCGSHKRNAYGDILELLEEGDGTLSVSLSKDSLYDILPEGLFHPLDRFDNIPANEYAERFAEECAKQEQEEHDAREFFKGADTFITELNCLVSQIKNREYSGSEIIANMIMDGAPEQYRDNRFVKAALPFVPIAHKIRGNRAFMTLMLRKIMKEEGLTLRVNTDPETFEDPEPRYNCQVREEDPQEDLFLGNSFEESPIRYTITYWDDNECNERFLDFIEEIRVFESFCCDFFAGIESRIEFDITTDALPVRLSDDLYHNYLNYNTNI